MFGLTELNICRMSAKFLQVQELPGSVGKGFLPEEAEWRGNSPALLPGEGCGWLLLLSTPTDRAANPE